VKSPVLLDVFILFSFGLPKEILKTFLLSLSC